MNNQAQGLLLLGSILLATIVAAHYNPETEVPQNPSQYIEHLQNQLNEAVENEDFEKACLLRDMINDYGKG